jgi:hypothetical protein
LFEHIGQKFRSEAPVKHHETFVVGTEKDENNKRFLIVWTTPSLLSVASASNQTVIQIDTTYKIIYFGYPVLVSDK